MLALVVYASVKRIEGDHSTISETISTISGLLDWNQAQESQAICSHSHSNPPRSDFSCFIAAGNFVASLKRNEKGEVKQEQI